MHQERQNHTTQLWHCCVWHRVTAECKHVRASESKEHCRGPGECCLKMVVRTAEMMRGPPLAPMTARRAPRESVTMVGDMLDCGFLPGRMKLLGEGGSPYLRASTGTYVHCTCMLRIANKHKAW